MSERPPGAEPRDPDLAPLLHVASSRQDWLAADPVAGGVAQVAACVARLDQPDG